LTPIADLRLQLLRHGAKRKSTVHVTIGPPQPNGNDWSCPIRLKGLVGNKERQIFGVDSWQAMTPALKCFDATLQNEIRKGGELYYLGGETSVAELFATRMGGRRSPASQR